MHLDLASSYFKYGLIITTILNGAPFYLRRIGLIDTVEYNEDLNNFCTHPINTFWISSSCHYRKVITNLPLEWTSIEVTRLYSLNMLDVALKTSKYLLLAFLLLVSLVNIVKKKGQVPTKVQILPVLPIFISVLFSIVIGVYRQGSISVLEGILRMAWLPLLLGGSWLSIPSRLQKSVDSVAILILSQIPLSIIEAMKGLPLPFGRAYKTLYSPVIPFPSRLVQSFNNPNTLGIVLVVFLGYYIAYSTRTWLAPILIVCIIPLLFLARSGTGLLVLTVISSLSLLYKSSWQSSFRVRNLLIFFLIVFIIALILPFIISRSDLYNSFLGRFRFLMNLFQNSTTFQIIFGDGFGSISNIHSILGHSTGVNFGWTEFSANQNLVINTDSMINYLQIQSGLFGVISFYGLLIWAMLRNPKSAPFILTLILCSFTINILEIVSLNILLAISLNHCILAERNLHKISFTA